MTAVEFSAVAAAVADAHRREWAFVLAATVRVTRDLAEECVQEAFAAALTDWRTSGIPARPGAWLTTTAGRRTLGARQAYEEALHLTENAVERAFLSGRLRALGTAGW